MNPILVVDDEPDIRQMLCSLLELEGYACRMARDGREALNLIQMERPSLILLDLNMPVMTGWELHDALRADGDDIPVVYMSAAYRVSQEAAARGAVGCLPKPFDLDDVLRTVGQFAA